MVMLIGNGIFAAERVESTRFNRPVREAEPIVGGSQIEAVNSNAQQQGTPARIADALTHTRMVALLLLLGIGLRVWAYAGDTSLYLDEILLSRNILDLPLGQLLTKPLALDQVAPRGFLLIERLVVAIFGPSELALRLLPFVCGIAGLVVFWRLVKRVVNDTASAVGLFLFAIGVPFIRFGAEVKQYECDLLAATVLTLLAFKLHDREASKQRLVIAGLGGFLVIWFSQTSVLVMAGLGAALAVEWLISRDRRTRRALLITIPLWAVASLVAVVVGFRSMTPSTRQFMNEFWAGAFFPLPFDWRSAATWIGQRFTELFSDATLLHYRWPAAFVLLAMIGIIVIWRHNRMAALVLCGPPLVALGAAIAHQYPWRGRLAFWMLPAAVIAVAAGTEWILGKASALHPAIGLIFLIAVLAAPVIALAEAPPPYELEHHRDMLKYLQQRRQPGDVIYVVQLQEIGTQFYGPRYGLQPNQWVTGVCDANDARAFLRDLDRFRGVGRLWLLTGSGRPLGKVHSAIRNYLGTIGVRRDVKTFPSMTLGFVSIELYDLSDPVRLGSATAEEFPMPAMPRDPKIGCRDWTKPEFDWHLARP